MSGIFKILEKNFLNLKRSKTTLFKRRARLLGAIVGGGEARLDAEKVGSMLKMQRPKNVKELRSFLGTTGAQRQFIPCYSDLAHSLTELTKKGCGWHWGDTEEKSFQSLMKVLTTAPVLHLPDPHAKGYRLSTDASSYAVGAMLEQLQDDGTGNLEYNTVGFASKKLSSAETNYSVGDKELLALVFGVRAWSSILRYSPVTCLTDNRSLAYLFSKSPALLSPREWRMRTYLLGFACDIKWVAGEENTTADFLSRLPGSGLEKLTVLELCAGAGSTIRALGDLASAGLIRTRGCIEYYAVEQSKDARDALTTMYKRVTKEHPNLFSNNDPKSIFPLKHDVREVLSQPRVRKSNGLKVDLILSSPPCQGFSRANTNAQGMADKRELFTATAEIITEIRKHNRDVKFVVENVNFGEKGDAPNLCQAKVKVDELFHNADPKTWSVQKNMSSFVPQSRKRRFWTNIDSGAMPPWPAEGAGGTYADLLQDMGLPGPHHAAQEKLARTVMAHAKAATRVNGANNLKAEGTDEEKRNGVPPPVRVEERLCDFREGDSSAQDSNLKWLSEVQRRKHLGNSWCPPCIGHWLLGAFKDSAVVLSEDKVEYEFDEDVDVLLIEAAGTVDPLIDGHPHFRERLAKATQEEPNLIAKCRSETGGGNMEEHQVRLGEQTLPIFRDKEGRWVIPEGSGEEAAGLRTAICQAVHNYGHRNGRENYEIVRHAANWKHMRRDLLNWSRACTSCQLGRVDRTRRSNRLRPTPMPKGAHESISMDFVELVPATGRYLATESKSYDMLLVCRDRFSRFTRLIPIQKRGFTSESLAETMLHGVLPFYRRLQTVYSDRDRLYTGRAYRHVRKLYGVQGRTTVAHRPQGDGLAERTIQDVLNFLRKQLVDTEDSSELPRTEPLNWIELLPIVEEVLNSYRSRSTGYSPT